MGLPMAAVVVFVVILVGAFAWPLTAGRRYFEGRRRTTSDVRRDLYTSSLDEGMYPLTPPADKER